MSRASKAESEEHRLAITEHASRLFGEKGVEAVTVAEVMAAAGLTHGGFYGHFESKSELAAAACEAAFARAVRRWRRDVETSDTPGAAYEALIERFLLPATRDAPGTACPSATLCADAARAAADSPLRASFAKGIENLTALLTSLCGGGAAAQDHALADLATLVGAVLLARATAGKSISDDLLRAARQRLADS